MAIQWPTINQQSSFSFWVTDKDGVVPFYIIETDPIGTGTTPVPPAVVKGSFEVPLALVPYINASDTFEIRAYAESMGPGPEKGVGNVTVTGSAGQTTPYSFSFGLNTSNLLAEGEPVPSDPGEVASGVYRLTCVLQHLSGGVRTQTSGCVTTDPLLMIC